MIAQIFDHTATLLIPTGTKTKEANVETKTQPVTAETKKVSVQYNLNTYMYFYSIIKSLCFISSRR